MKDVMEVVEDWVGEGDPVALATVVDTKKSAPQPPGTKMAINDAGKMAGAVSGGCVEGQVVQVAEGILRGGDPQLLNYGIADEDAWDVGLPCGGEISIWVETYEDAGLQGRFRELGRRGGRGALTTVLEGPENVGAKLLLLEDGTSQGTLEDPELDAAAMRRAGSAMWSERSELYEVGETKLFVDVVAPQSDHGRAGTRARGGSCGESRPARTRRHGRLAERERNGCRAQAPRAWLQ